MDGLLRPEGGSVEPLLSVGVGGDDPRPLPEELGSLDDDPAPESEGFFPKSLSKRVVSTGFGMAPPVTAEGLFPVFNCVLAGVEGVVGLALPLAG